MSEATPPLAEEPGEEAPLPGPTPQEMAAACEARGHSFAYSSGYRRQHFVHIDERGIEEERTFEAPWLPMALGDADEWRRLLHGGE